MNFRALSAALMAACLLCGHAGALPFDGEAELLPVTLEDTAARTEDAFLDYLEHLAGLDGELLSAVAGESLTGCNRVMYDYLVAEAKKLTAQGRDGDDPFSTWFTATLTMDRRTGESERSAMDRQFDFGTVVSAAFADYPCEFFWHDLSYSLSTKVLNSSGTVLKVSCTIKLTVSEDYQGADQYHLRTNLRALADKTVSAAKDIAARNAGKSDYEKLTAFRDAICGLVSYNDDAADDSTNTPYGNPWQLIWVFDGDPSTNVVCEGYSKAFKFLCDISTFQDPDFACLIIWGTMQGSSGSGGHMWNHVYLDGKAYLADVTNCDEDTVGAVKDGGGLFMDAPVSGHTAWNSWYVFEIVHGRQSTRLAYGIDDDQTEIYPEKYLNLSETAYRPADNPGGTGSDPWGYDDPDDDPWGYDDPDDDPWGYDDPDDDPWEYDDPDDDPWGYDDPDDDPWGYDDPDDDPDDDPWGYDDPDDDPWGYDDPDDDPWDFDDSDDYPWDPNDTDGLVFTEMFGNDVLVTVTGNRYIGKTVWAAAYGPGGRLLCTDSDTLDSDGYALVTLKLAKAVEFRAFVVDGDTLLPLLAHIEPLE